MLNLITGQNKDVYVLGDNINIANACSNNLQLQEFNILSSLYNVILDQVLCADIFSAKTFSDYLPIFISVHVCNIKIGLNCIHISTLMMPIYTFKLF